MRDVDKHTILFFRNIRFIICALFTQSLARVGKIIKAHMELSLRINFHTFGRFVLLCSSYEDFFNDMKTAVHEMSALRNDIKAILVSTADMTNITGDSDICIVTDVGADNDHMVDVIANYTAANVI
uniref:Ovule protein n=1 Tax=Parascaris univalens TaxID=6257 RepID=A0A915CL79_PARUN